MKTRSPYAAVIGWLLIIGVLGISIPYSILTFIFEYPDILREDTSNILIKFHNGGNYLILAWFSFALLGLPLIPAFVLIGKQKHLRSSFSSVATTLGLIGLIVQVIGLLRWTFVVPVLAENYIHSTDPAIKASAIMSFKVIHQFGGVLLGEHLGQLFTIAWSIMISVVFLRSKWLPKWMHIFGISSALIYLIAQAELLQTVMPDMIVWELAGLIGSTLWLIWLLCIGIGFLRLARNVQ